LVEASVAKELESLLVEKAAKVKVGDPFQADTILGPMITRAQFDCALEYLQIGPQEGCRVLAGGGPLEMTGPLADGLWLQPTMLADVRADMRVGCEEIFGPVLSILEFEDQAEAVQIANSVEYGLSGSVWTSNVDRALQMVDSLDTGLIWVNTMLAGYPQIPLSPHKMSGTGVELGREGLLPYLKRKSAVIANNTSAPVGWMLG